MEAITQDWIDEALNIRYLIMQNNGNASKTAVEDVLMKRHPGLERYDAHQLMNHIEQYQLDRDIMHCWKLKRPAPTMEQYPEIWQCHIRWYKERGKV